MELFKDYIRTEDNKEAVIESENFINSRCGLYLYGKTGCGKSHLANEVFRYVRNQAQLSRQAAFITMTELLSKMKSNLDYVDDIIDDHTYELTHLFLDDIGSEKITEFTLEKMFIIIDRWTKKRNPKIFITSNLNPSELEEKTSDRIVSRIYEICKIVQIKGNTDYRILKNKELK